MHPGEAGLDSVQARVALTAVPHGSPIKAFQRLADRTHLVDLHLIISLLRRLGKRRHVLQLFTELSVARNGSGIPVVSTDGVSLGVSIFVVHIMPLWVPIRDETVSIKGVLVIALHLLLWNTKVHYFKFKY